HRLVRALPPANCSENLLLMNEQNENQSATGPTRGGEPAPLEAESASAEQRHHRPRRRFPRRRYRSDRFRRDNSEESPNSSSANADNAGGDVAVETLEIGRAHV